MNLRLVLSLLPALLQAHPGDTLPSNFPTFSTQATVSATAIAPDGSVFIAGDFAEIDGTTRIGLAKLAEDGTLDDSFAPSPTAAISGGLDGLFGNPDPFPRLFALPGGRLMVLHQGSWNFLDSDGASNETLFPELPRTAAPPPRPQFIEDGRIVMITGTEPELRAYRAHDLLPEAGFAASPGPHPPAEAVPAADGKIWVLGRDPSENPWFFFPSSYPEHPEHTLYRLELSGAIDLTFTPRELSAENSYSLRTAPDGGFRLIHEWMGGYQLWPTATNRSFTAERFDTSGNLQGRVSFRLPFSSTLQSVAFQLPDLAIHPALDASALIRALPGSYHPDPDFRIALAAPRDAAIHPLVTRTVGAFPDGRLLVGGTRRFLADGDPDPTWHVPRLSKNSIISQLVALPGGAVLAGGDFDQVDGLPAPGLVKLLPDDTLDPTLTPTWDFRFAQKLIPLPDHSILCLFKSPVTGIAQSGGYLVRFDSDGAFLSLWPIPPPPGNATISYGQVTDFAVQSDGTTLVTTFQNNGVPTSRFFRIPPDGLSQIILGSPANSDMGSSLLVLHDDSYLRGTAHHEADGTFITTVEGISHATPRAQLPDLSVIFARSPNYLGGPVLQRWHPQKGIDHSFVDPFHDTKNVRIAGIAPAADGKILVWGDVGGAPLVRLHATGQLDPTFRPPPGEIHSALSNMDGTILVGGLIDPANNLALLADFRVAGYETWIAAATSRLGWSSQDLARDADPDGDGVSNFLEYAAGSDPTRPDPMASGPVRIGPLTWRVSSNPEAPEIRRSLETTTDLTHWQPATASELRLETQQPVLTWTLMPGSTRLFTRVRVE